MLLCRRAWRHRVARISMPAPRHFYMFYHYTCRIASFRGLGLHFQSKFRPRGAAALVRTQLLFYALWCECLWSIQHTNVPFFFAHSLTILIGRPLSSLYGSLTTRQPSPPTSCHTYSPYYPRVDVHTSAVHSLGRDFIARVPFSCTLPHFTYRMV